MHIRWFGEPWGRVDRETGVLEKRAAVCESDKFRVPVPTGTKCLLCNHQIAEDDQGVVTACSPGIFGHWMLRVSGADLPVCSYHMFCFIKSVMGSDGLSEEILAKMRFRAYEEEPTGVVTHAEPERVEPGRGWGHVHVEEVAVEIETDAAPDEEPPEEVKSRWKRK